MTASTVNWAGAQAGSVDDSPPASPPTDLGDRPEVAQVRIRRPALDVAYRLMDAYGLTKVVDVIGRALALLDFVHRRQEQGYTILLRAPDGTLREPELIFLD